MGHQHRRVGSLGGGSHFLVIKGGSAAGFGRQQTLSDLAASLVDDLHLALVDGKFG